jgi:hypothetical protein
MAGNVLTIAGWSGRIDRDRWCVSHQPIVVTVDDGLLALLSAAYEKRTKTPHNFLVSGES